MTVERGFDDDTVSNFDLSPTGLAKLAVALIVISALALSFVVSFAAFIYNGLLASHLSMGIGLALIGSVAMPIIVAFRSTGSGVVCHVQDAPTLLLAGAAASIAAVLSTTAPEQMFPTVATLVGVTSIFTGITLFLAGRFRLGAIARFIPYSVIGGFLAATGLLLTTGAISMILKDTITVWNLATIFESGKLVFWLPWFAFSALLVLLTRNYKSEMTLPAALALAAVVFFTVLYFKGMDLEQAGELNLLLGPFPNDSFFQGLSFDIPAQANWGEIVTHSPTIIAVAGVSAIGLLLNSSALEVALDQELDLEHELKTVGSSNVISGMTGGFVGFHLLGETIFANKMGATGRAAGIAVGLSAMVPLVLGTQIIGAFPVGLAASVVAYLGLDLLYEWIWVQRRRLPRGDKLIIALILMAAATLGFLQALALGLLAALILFVMSYARVDVVRLKTSIASRRSSIERGPEELAYLADHGAGSQIFELSGYLFFGTANSLMETLKEEVSSASPPRAIIFDFTHVIGLDTSANFALTRIAEICALHGVTFAVSGASETLVAQLKLGEAFNSSQNYTSLDDALISLEADVLARSENIHSSAPVQNLLKEILPQLPQIDPAQFTQHLSLAAGDALFTEQSKSTEVYQLLSGELRAEISDQDRNKHVVARFRPGALVGEMAYYANAPRSAAIVADTPVEVLQISLENIPATIEGRAVAAELHRRAAGYLAQRVLRMNKLFRDAGF